MEVLYNSLWSVLLQGLFLVDGQALACNDFNTGRIEAGATALIVLLSRRVLVKSDSLTLWHPTCRSLVLRWAISALIWALIVSCSACAVSISWAASLY